MKEIKDIIKVSLNYNELMNCCIVDSNRCGHLAKEDALKNGFSETDWNKFIARAKKLKNIIKSKGFSKGSFFVLAKDENGNLYLLDGQGRRMALKLMKDEGKDFSNMEFICDLYVNPMSKQEMSKLIIELNTGNTNWQTKDIRRSDVLSSDDESVKTAYKYTKNLMEKHSLTDYIVNLLTYGESASHQRQNGSNPFSEKNYATTKEVFTEAYLKFICNASYTIDKDGNEVERSKKALQRIRHTSIAISYNTCLRKIVKFHNNDVNDAKEDIMIFTDKLIESLKGTDSYLMSVLNNPQKDGAFIANIVKSRCRNKNLVNALYAYENR